MRGSYSEGAHSQDRQAIKLVEKGILSASEPFKIMAKSLSRHINCGLTWSSVEKIE